MNNGEEETIDNIWKKYSLMASNMAFFAVLTTKKESRLVNSITCKVLSRNELWINLVFHKETKEGFGHNLLLQRRTW